MHRARVNKKNEIELPQWLKLFQDHGQLHIWLLQSGMKSKFWIECAAMNENIVYLFYWIKSEKCM